MFQNRNTDRGTESALKTCCDKEQTTSFNILAHFSHETSLLIFINTNTMLMFCKLSTCYSIALSGLSSNSGAFNAQFSSSTRRPINTQAQNGGNLAIGGEEGPRLILISGGASLQSLHFTWIFVYSLQALKACPEVQPSRYIFTCEI